MKRLFLIMTLLGGLLFCLSSCDKLGDEESDGENGGKPVKPDYKEYSINGRIIYQDSILYDNSDFKQDIN